MNITGRECMLTLETPDGVILSGKAMVSELVMATEMLEVREFGKQYPDLVPGLRTWQIEAVGAGELTTRDEYEKKAARKRAAVEWTCPYCGRVHPKARLKCWDGSSGCGASRPVTGVADL